MDTSVIGVYRSFLEHGKLVRYILHSDGQIQRTMVWYEEGKRKSDWVIIAVDGDEESFDMIVLAAEIRRKEFETLGRFQSCEEDNHQKPE